MCPTWGSVTWLASSPPATAHTFGVTWTTSAKADACCDSCVGADASTGAPTHGSTGSDHLALSGPFGPPPPPAPPLSLGSWGGWTAPLLTDWKRFLSVPSRLASHLIGRGGRPCARISDEFEDAYWWRKLSEPDSYVTWPFYEDLESAMWLLQLTSPDPKVHPDAAVNVLREWFASDNVLDQLKGRMGFSDAEVGSIYRYWAAILSCDISINIVPLDETSCTEAFLHGDDASGDCTTKTPTAVFGFSTVDTIAVCENAFEYYSARIADTYSGPDSEAFATLNDRLACWRLGMAAALLHETAHLAFNWGFPKSSSFPGWDDDFRRYAEVLSESITNYFLARLTSFVDLERNCCMPDLPSEPEVPREDPDSLPFDPFWCTDACSAVTGGPSP